MLPNLPCCSQRPAINRASLQFPLPCQWDGKTRLQSSLRSPKQSPTSPTTVSLAAAWNARTVSNSMPTPLRNYCHHNFPLLPSGSRLPCRPQRIPPFCLPVADLYSTPLTSSSTIFWACVKAPSLAAARSDGSFSMPSTTCSALSSPTTTHTAKNLFQSKSYAKATRHGARSRKFWGGSLTPTP
jgi:hypothetical protein